MTKREKWVSALVALALVAWLAAPASADTFTWKDVTGAWNVSTNWDEGAVPDSIDDVSTVAQGTMQVSNTIATIPGQVWINGTDGVGGTMQIGTLNATYNATGGLYLNGGRLYSNISQSSVFLGGTIVAQAGSTSIIETGGSQNLTVNGALTGSGTINKTGAYGLQVWQSSGSGFTGTINVRTGGLVFTNSAGGTYSFGGAIRLDSGAYLNNGSSGHNQTVSGGIVLAGGQVRNTANNYVNYLTSPLTVESNSFVSTTNNSTGAGGNVTFGGTVGGSGGLNVEGNHTLAINGSGSTWSGSLNVFSGKVSAGASADLGSGLARVLPLGTLELNAAGNATGRQVAVSALGSSGAAQGVLSLKYNGAPTVTSDSAGVVAIDSTSFDAISSLASLGNGQMFLGATGTAGKFTGASLSAGSGSAYRLGGGGGTLTLDAAGAGVLTGANDVVVGRTGGGRDFAGTVVLADANDFSGTLTVNRGSVLTGNAQASGAGSPLGNTGGAVALNGGTLGVANSVNSARQVVEKGALTFSGASGITVAGIGANGYTELNLASLTRDATYKGAILFSGLTASPTNKVTADAAPAVTNGMVAPYYISGNPAGYGNCDFMTYGANGFAVFSNYLTADATWSNVTDPTRVVSTATAVVNSDTTVYALQGGYGTNLSGTGKITITSGGLNGFFGSNTSISNTLAFGSAEAIINNNQSTVMSLAGDIQGAGGITKTGRGATSLSTVDKTFTGDITILAGTLVASGSGGVVNGRLGPNTNTVVLNGGTLQLAGGNNTSFDHPIVVGPNGGTVANGSDYAKTHTYNAPITGPGLLTIYSTQGNSGFVLASDSNTYSGGTYVPGYSDFDSGRPYTVTVNADSSMGAGDLTTSAHGRVTINLLGYQNLASTATLSTGYYTTVNMRQAAATYQLAALIGGGSFVLGPTSGSGTTTLEVNGSGASDFVGTIADSSTGSSRLGALTKDGAGALTLWGDSTYTGATTVDGGLLAVMGSLGNTAVTVNSGGTLGGTGTIGGAVAVVGGALAPGASPGTLTLANGLVLDADSALDFELGALAGPNDLIDITAGDLTLDGVVNVTDAGGLEYGVYTLITYVGGLTDNGLAVGTLPAGFLGSIDTSTAGEVNLVVSAVPEPATVAFLAAGGLAMIGGAAARRRRRG